MKKIICIITIFAVLLSGCSHKNDISDSAQTNSDEISKKGGTIKLGCVPIDTLNPLVTSHASISDFLSLIYEGLFETMPDQTAEPVLASEYVSSEDNTVYTIKLKEGVEFHNGKSFSSEDVVATLDYIFLYDGKYSYIRNNIVTYSALSPYAVEIRLSSPVSDFMNLFDFPILPSGLTGDAFMPQNSDFVPIGTGMYKYDSSVTQKNIYLKANENRHSSLPAPYIETVDVEILSDEETVISAFDAGVTDILTTSWKDGSEMNLTASLYNTYYTLGNKYTFVGINTRCSAFDTVEERRQLRDKIDAERLCEDIMLKHAEAAYAPMRDGVYYTETAADTDSSKTLIDDDVTDEKASPKEEDKNAENDKETEQKSEKDSNTIVILYNSDSKTKERLAISLSHQLETAGYTCSLLAEPFTSYLEKVANCHYDLYVGEVNLDNSANLSFMFGADRSPQNICSYTDPELETLVSNINRMSGKGIKTVAWENFEKYYKEKVFQIPLYFTKREVYVNKRISGKLTPNISSLLSGFDKLYIESGK